MLSRWDRKCYGQVLVWMIKEVNSLPDDRILDWSKLRQIADGILTISQTTYFRLFQTERGCNRQFQIR